MSLSPPIVDYYRILEIQESATPDDIRRAYRRLAKQYHPDLHEVDRKEWARGQFNRISQAYEILGDLAARQDYDTRYQLYARFLNRHTHRSSLWLNKTEQTCQTILSALLDSQPEEAIRIYEKLKRESKAVEPLACLDSRDCLDCKFLLAEAYEKRKDLTEAIRFYEAVFEEEAEVPRMRCYYEELLERLRHLYASQLSSATNEDSARRFHQKALYLEHTGGATANLHRRMAETMMRLGFADQAGSFLKKAFQSNPNLKYAQKLCTQLNYSPKGI